MLDEKDLQAIAQLMDAKLAEQKKDIMSEVNGSLSEQKKDIMSDVKLLLEAQKKEILEESTYNMNILLENVVTPKFTLLAENQRDIMDKLVPRARVDELEDEVKFLKVIVRQMNEDIQTLKKAN